MVARLEPYSDDMRGNHTAALKVPSRADQWDLLLVLMKVDQRDVVMAA